MWNTIVNINSVLVALRKPLHHLRGRGVDLLSTPRPLELGVILVSILICTEIVFAAIEEVS